MSFSMEVKTELESRTDSARHCQIAEFTAFMGMAGRIRRKIGGEIQLEFIAENGIVYRKFMTLLLKIFDIAEDKVNVIHEGSRVTCVRIEKPECVAGILMTIKWADERFDQVSPVFADSRIIQKECCKKAFIRGAFLVAGSLSDPNKFYHYEIVCAYEDDAAALQNILCFFGLDAKTAVRKNNYIVYLKEGNNITDVLNIMGAYVAQMDLYNVMILKGMRNDVNRKVNCETANLNKTVAAAVKQIRDIEYVRDTIGLDSLAEGLRQVAVIRLENPDMNLKDIGGLLNPPIGKSGVNHRLRKISMIADEYRVSRGD